MTIELGLEEPSSFQPFLLMRGFSLWKAVAEPIH